MKDALVALIGQYVQSVVPLYNDEMQVVCYVHSPDYAWILSAILCIVIVYCFCKALGGLLCRM